MKTRLILIQKKFLTSFSKRNNKHFFNKKINVSVSYYKTFSRVMILFFCLPLSNFLFSQKTILNTGFEDELKSLATHWTINPLNGQRIKKRIILNNEIINVQDLHP